MAGIQLGERAEIKDGVIGIVRHYGTTRFAEGIWVGLELPDPSGKNDGSVQGHRYFTCKPAHGSFVREAAIVRIHAPAISGPTALSRRSTLDGQRTSSQQTSSSGIAKSQAGSQASSRHGSPTKQNRTAPSVRNRTTLGAAPDSTNARPPSAASNVRAGITALSSSTTAAGAFTRPRNSLGARVSAVSRIKGTSEDPIRSETGSRPTTHSSGRRSSNTASSRSSVSSAIYTDSRDVAQPVDIDRTPTAVDRPSRSAVEPEIVSSADPFAVPYPTNDSRRRDEERLKTQAEEIKTLRGQNLDLMAKLRDVTKERTQDNKRLHENADAARDRDRLNDLLVKLKQKYKPLEQEVADLRNRLAEQQTQDTDIEEMQAGHDAALEEAALDREMAEEQAEVLKTELAALRETSEEMKLELEILRSENLDLGREVDPGERTSQSYLQLERSNERLREALVRLRDASQDSEAELKTQLKELKQDADAAIALKDELTTLQQSANDKDSLISDLQLQLEAAQGSEHLVEQLSDQNQQLQEQIERFREDIDNLEGLNALNDELIVNHVESEKQYQQEIDFRDTVISNLDRLTKDQEANIEQHDSSVLKYRQAVQSMQSELAELRASRLVSEVEADDLTRRTQQLMDRNLRLSSSAAKIRVKTIDLELDRMEAEEATRHLAIVQHFLPESYKADQGSILALLRVGRIRFKATLIRRQLQERLEDAEDVGQMSMAVYTVMDQLCSLAAICQRFDRHISACSLERFRAYQTALYDFEPVEKILQGQLEELKQDSIRCATLDQDLGKSMAVMIHLESVHIVSTPETIADGVIARADATQSRLECLTLALIGLKKVVDSVLHSSTSNADSNQRSSNTVDAIDERIGRVRQDRLRAVRLYQDLTEIRDRALGLQDTSTQGLPLIEADTTQALNFICVAGENVAKLLEASETSSGNNLSPSTVDAAIMSASAACYSTSHGGPAPFGNFDAFLERLTVRINEGLIACSNESAAVELKDMPQPWIELSRQIAKVQSSHIEATAELDRLRSTVSERTLQIRHQEQAMAEQEVKIRFLEARTADVGDKRAKIQAYEKEIESLKQASAEVKAEADGSLQTIRRLREERDDYKARLGKNAVIDGTTAASSSSRVAQIELDVQRARIKALQATIRQLSDGHVAAVHVKPGVESTGTKADLTWLKGTTLQRRSSRKSAKDNVLGEERMLLRELLHMPASLQPVDMSSLRGQDKLKWRPATARATWVAQKRREEWETWLEWQHDLASRVTGIRQRTRRPSAVRGERLPLETSVKAQDGMNDAVMIASQV